MGSQKPAEIPTQKSLYRRLNMRWIAAPPDKDKQTHNAQYKVTTIIVSLKSTEVPHAWRFGPGKTPQYGTPVAWKAGGPHP